MWFQKSSVPRFARRRKIARLLHSTHLTINLPQIFQDGYLDTALGLRNRFGANAERMLHDPRRFEHYAVGLEFINCALTVPNYELLYARSKSAWKSEWAHLELNLDLLERADTLFCAISAAAQRGRHVSSGLPGLTAMFERNVEAWSREGLERNIPTHPQAEVLIRGPLELARVTLIHVADLNQVQELERLLEFYRRTIPVRATPGLFLWPTRLSQR